MTPSSKTTVMLVDDHLVVRMGLASIISRDKNLLLVGEADCGEDAIILAKKLKPQVIVMDLKMPTKDGSSTTAHILRDLPDTKILILTSFADASELNLAFNAGAIGALLKTSKKEEIISAISAVATGKRVISPELEELLDKDSPASSLSPRQIEIIQLVAKGYSNKDIATHLSIGSESVKQHLKTAFIRLGASSRAEAVAMVLGNR